MKYIDDFLKYLEYEKHFSHYTVSNYQIDLEEFKTYIQTDNPNEINLNQIRKYLKFLVDNKYSSRSISRKVSSLKSYFKYLDSEKLIKDNPAALVSNPKIEKSLPNYLNYEDTEKLLNIPNLKTKDGKRDALILEMLYSSGVRVSELTNIKLEDIDFQDKKIIILGKGNKQRS